MRQLELLAPAKNLEVGLAAIDCGADAVYIGAEEFGARAAAGNSLDDIATLADYAHQFGAKVYVTINTLLRDDELSRARELIYNVRARGADAVLIQDLRLLELCNTAPRPTLHASTQTDNRSRERVGELRAMGFRRVVLARELALEEIRAIHNAYPDLELEVFVHGALCVSYSGACYASEHCFGRSANRGECAQVCRMRFDLIDSDGTIIKHNAHLLSLKDLALLEQLEELADAGAVSFKIEGRLKDIDYVKNVVAAYSQRLNAIIAHRPNNYCRSSAGRVSYSFTPNIHKTFNRGYTTHFLNGRQPDIANFITPKSMGERVTPNTIFANGDGLCFVNASNELEGFRVNNATTLRFPESYQPGMPLYRNHDAAFEKILNGACSTRRLPLPLRFGLTDNGFYLSALNAISTIAFAHEPAKKSQRENIIKQLSRWGNTIYEIDDITITDDADQYFIPSSLLSTLRQELTLQLSQVQEENQDPPTESA